MALRIDLNCDLGESLGPWRLGQDEALLPLITSANVACGFHAGDPQVMARTVALAAAYGVAVGAHPGYRDLHGFGRRPLQCSEDEVYGDVLYQIGALTVFCQARGVPLHHVKAHGALYNAAGRHEPTARALVRAVRDAGPGLALYAPAGGLLARVGEAAGLRVAREAFADRAYNRDGTLVARDRPGAVLHDPAAVAERVLRMVTEGRVWAVDGSDLAIQADTVCIHGDMPNAPALVRAVRERLQAAGVAVAPL